MLQRLSSKSSVPREPERRPRIYHLSQTMISNKLTPNSNQHSKDVLVSKQINTPNRINLTKSQLSTTETMDDGHVDPFQYSPPTVPPFMESPDQTSLD